MRSHLANDIRPSTDRAISVALQVLHNKNPERFHADRKMRPGQTCRYCTVEIPAGDISENTDES